MEIRNNSGMSFQARIPKETNNYLRNEALNYGGKAMRALRNKMSEISTWGSSDVAIELNYMDRNTKAISFSDPIGFVLTNNKAKLADEVELPNRGKSILQRFMRLTKDDVVNAETELTARIAKSEDNHSPFDLFI